MMSLDALQATGRSDSHVQAWALADGRSFTAHPQAAQALLAMAQAAQAEGIDLAVASAFRSFADQARIWSAKWRGERPLYDARGQLLDATALDDSARVAAILEWSALPGASRHHWGSEFDVFDRAAMPTDYRLQLMPEEYAPGGIFARLTDWLDQHMTTFGFFRPYDIERGGIHVEPWHLSFAPVAVPALQTTTAALIAQAVAEADLPGQQAVLACIDTIHACQVCRVAAPASYCLNPNP